MKKNISKVIASLLSVSLILLFSVPISASFDINEGIEDPSYYSTESVAYLNAPKPMQNVMDMQNEITLSLNKSNFKYKYDYEVIKEIVYAFDFTEINLLTGGQITSEGFLEMAIEGIESVRFPAIETYAYTTGPMCGVNKTDSIWNSTREYRNKSRTTTHANYLMAEGKFIQANSANLTAGGFRAIVAGIAVWSPPLAAAIKVVKGGYGAIGWWMRNVSTSLTNSNKKNSCGTVLDINLVGWYSSWNQIDN